MSFVFDLVPAVLCLFDKLAGPILTSRSLFTRSPQFSHSYPVDQADLLTPPAIVQQSVTYLPHSHHSPDANLHRNPNTSTTMLAARAARPKLMLAVPTAAPATLAKSPLPRTPVSLSPMSPTVRNTHLNQRGFSTSQPSTFAYAQSSNTKSILKKGQASSSTGKKLQFREEPAVRCISPVPDDYHGTYVKMSKDERRWGSGRGL